MSDIDKKPHPIDRVITSLDTIYMRCVDLLKEVREQIDYLEKIKKIKK